MIQETYVPARDTSHTPPQTCCHEALRVDPLGNQTSSGDHQHSGWWDASHDLPKQWKLLYTFYWLYSTTINQLLLLHVLSESGPIITIMKKGSTYQLFLSPPRPCVWDWVWLFEMSHLLWGFLPSVQGSTHLGRFLNKSFYRLQILKKWWYEWEQNMARLELEWKEGSMMSTNLLALWSLESHMRYWCQPLWSPLGGDTVLSSPQGVRPSLSPALRHQTSQAYHTCPCAHRRTGQRNSSQTSLRKKIWKNKDMML